MSLYAALCAGLLFPLHERIKGHDSVARRRLLEESQWWTPDQLQRAQLARLRIFLADIGERVPYYRDLFQRVAFDPAGIESNAALAGLPLLDKCTIRENVDRLQASYHGSLKRYNTGGSSGEPLIFYIGKDRISHDVAAKWRATRWWGVDIGDRELVVWGSPIELGAQDRLRRLRDAMLHSHLLPAFEMSADNLDHFVQAIRRIRPAMLFGYPSSLSVIARHARAHGIAMDGLGIRVAFVTSEKLYPDQRDVIGAVFGCPVANGYGARDAGFIAHECPSGSLHISAEDIIVETVAPDGSPAGAGEAGEIVITHMATAEFPFVRYRTGDWGVFGRERCACGRVLPVLADVQGRSTDFVVARDGTIMHGLALVYAVRDVPGVEKFKIEQITLDLTIVRLVTGAAFTDLSEARIVQDFKARLGTSVDIRVERVDEISAEASGKYRYVSSRVKAFDAPVAEARHV